MYPCCRWGCWRRLLRCRFSYNGGSQAWIHSLDFLFYSTGVKSSCTLSRIQWSRSKLYPNYWGRQGIFSACKSRRGSGYRTILRSTIYQTHWIQNIFKARLFHRFYFGSPFHYFCYFFGNYGNFRLFYLSGTIIRTISATPHLANITTWSIQRYSALETWFVHTCRQLEHGGSKRWGRRGKGWRSTTDRIWYGHTNQLLVSFFLPLQIYEKPAYSPKTARNAFHQKEGKWHPWIHHFQSQNPIFFWQFTPGL